MLKCKENRGITLIALVITIIVLLILAVVTISQLANSGLFNNTQEAKEKYNYESEREQLEIEIANFKMQKIVDNDDIELNNLKIYLESSKFNGKYEVELFYEPLATTEEVSTEPVYAKVTHVPTKFVFYVDGKLVVVGGKKSSEIKDDPTITYKITYHANNGTDDIEEVIANNKEKAYAIENKYSKERYQFVGWATNASANTKEYSVGDEIESNNEDIDLYAIWEIATIDFYWASQNNGSGMQTINKNKDEDLVLEGNIDVPAFYSNQISLKPNTGYLIEFDYQCESGTNIFNVDLYPDSLPEIYPTATTTKQHYKWFVYSSNSNMGNCMFRFFDDRRANQESDITISNVKFYEARNICENIELGFDQPVTIPGNVGVPCINSNSLNLEKNKTYVIEFDYYCLSGTNQFDVDLFPDTLPQIWPTATTTKQHYIWETSSSSNDMLNCRVRLFDDAQESSESDIIISNLCMYKKP